MAPQAHSERASPEFRATTYYFSFFMVGGAAVTLFPIWLTEKGISTSEIGIINSMPILIMLLLNLFIGRLADRASDWRQVIVAGALIAGIVPFLLFLVHDFVGILIVWTLMMVPMTAIAPIADAATIRMTRRNGTDFGAIRAWGTIGFMLLNVISGWLAGLLGSAIFVPLVVGLGLFRAATSLWLPRFRAPETTAPAPVTVLTASRLSELLRPWFLLPLVGLSMVFATHMILNSFAALFWQEQGIPEPVIGPLIATAAGSEAVMMFVFRRFAQRFPARYLILVSALVSAVRWGAMAFAPSIPVLVVLQLLHSITFAMGYLGGLNFIANWTSERIAAEAQSFFVVIQQAMTVVATIGFGYLAGAIGEKAFAASSVFALLGAAFVVVSLKLMDPARERDVGE
ncbi:MAG TPA: MFS transporter [Devosiaceae bacterium]